MVSGQALPKIGPWGITETNLTLRSMDFTLRLLEKKIFEFVDEIVPENALENKTYVVSHPQPNFQDNSKVLKQFIDNVVNDISE